MGGIDAVGRSGWLVRLSVGIGSLEKVLSNQVWKVRVANLLAKTV